MNDIFKFVVSLYPIIKLICPKLRLVISAPTADLFGHYLVLFTNLKLQKVLHQTDRSQITNKVLLCSAAERGQS